MDQLARKMHCEIPKGAGNKVDLVAAKIIDKSGINKLDSISKNILKPRKSTEISRKKAKLVSNNNLRHKCNRLKLKRQNLFIGYGFHHIN